MTSLELKICNEIVLAEYIENKNAYNKVLRDIKKYNDYEKCCNIENKLKILERIKRMIDFTLEQSTEYFKWL